MAEVAIPVVTDPNDGEGPVSVFGGGPIGVDETAVLEGNDFVVYTLTAGGGGGGGFGLSISNGENGIDSSDGGANVDEPNTNPVDPAIAAVNDGGRLQNGNAIRFSAWFQQDPNDPITKEPSVEPVLKLELWKEYGSDNGDFTSGRKPLADFGDRIWDTDINAPDPFWDGFDQSEASRIDVNNDGDIANGDELTTSLPPASGGFEWVLVESFLVIDDTPDDAEGFNWTIGEENFDVTAIEEVRATMFVGDFASNDLTDGGSFWADNLMLEVFPDEATMLATPNPNPMPEAAAGLPGDFNNDGVVGPLDYPLWRDNLGQDAAVLNGNGSGDASGLVVGSDYDLWVSAYGGGAGGPTAAAAPEPASVFLLSLGALALAARRRA